MAPRTPSAPDLLELLPSWELHLRAERKSDSTLKTYGDGVRRFAEFCTAHDLPVELDRAPVRAFLADMLETGAAPATARSRLLSLKRFSIWLVEEGELDADRIGSLAPPKLDTKVLEPLTDDELKALLDSCKGPDLRDKRDEAVLRLMLESGMRAGEVVALGIEDVDLRAGVATVRRGKGGKGRVVPFSAKAGQAIDRYLRARRSHSRADTTALWLGERGKGFTYYGLHAALGHRARLAGIDRFHPHLLRHTAAHRWLAAGGSEGGLMAVAGWTRPDMLMRYTQAQASSRAADEARRLNLGDL